MSDWEYAQIISCISSPCIFGSSPCISVSSPCISESSHPKTITGEWRSPHMVVRTRFIHEKYNYEKLLLKSMKCKHFLKVRKKENLENYKIIFVQR